MTNLKKVLLIESDVDLREALCEQLRNTDQFEVFSSGGDTETVEKLRFQSYDVIVVDLHPLNKDSLGACRLTYAQNVKCPILLLTERDEISSTVFGQDARASDYILKPFKFPILLARINIQLQKYERSNDSVFTLGPYTFIRL